MKRSWTALAVALAAIFAGSRACKRLRQTPFRAYGRLDFFLFTFPDQRLRARAKPHPAQISPLTVNGSGFLAKTVVQWNGKSIPTTVTTNALEACCR